MKNHQQLFRKLLCSLFAFLLLGGPQILFGAAGVVVSEADSGPGTLRQMIADGKSPITFAPHVEKIVLNSRLYIPPSQDVTIIGPEDQVTLEVSNSFSGDELLSIGISLGYSKSFHFENLIFRSGDSRALLAAGCNLTVKNCAFLDATMGAIEYSYIDELSAHNISIEGCNFEGNQIAADDQLINIFNYLGNVKVQNSSFIQNTRNGGFPNGNRYFIRLTTLGNLLVHNTTFSGNFLYGNGNEEPALVTVDKAKNYTWFTGCTFYENVAPRLIGYFDDPKFAQLPAYNAPTIEVRNSLFSRNYYTHGMFASNTDLYRGTIMDVPMNQIGSPVTLKPGVLLDTDPMLSEHLLEGPNHTKAHPLLPGSPAIGAGFDYLYTQNFDQFETPRVAPGHSGTLEKVIGGTVSSTQDYAPGATPVEGSLRKVMTDAPAGSEIYFDLPEGSSIVLQSEIVVDKNLLLKGPGRDVLTVDGNWGTRMFRVTGTGDLRVSGLRFHKGQSSSGFGAVVKLEAGGIFGATDCRFSNNRVSGYYGGGVIYIHPNGSAAFTRCLFDYNSAQNGGVVHTSGGIGAFHECSFWHNAALYGGVGRINHQDGDLRFTNCSFGDNGNVNGGGIYYYGHAAGSVMYSAGTNFFISCTFVDNKSKASSSAGAIVGTGNTMDKPWMQACLFYGNNDEGGSEINFTGNTEELYPSFYGQDPLLENYTLDFDQGITCFKLKPSSPAINVYPTYTAAYKDQLGNLRGNFNGAPEADAGAYELQGCVEDDTYCYDPPYERQEEYIDSITFDGQKRVTGDNGGYAFFTDPVLEIPVDRPFDFSLTVSHIYAVYPMIWRVRIDMDMDGDLSDEYPIVYTGHTAGSIDHLNGTIDLTSYNLPVGFTTVMEVYTDDPWYHNLGVWPNNSYPTSNPNCGSIYGEIERYVVRFTEGTANKTMNQGAPEPTPHSISGPRPSPSERQGVLSAYPNPASSVVNLRVSGADGGLGQITLYNLQGKLVHQQQTTQADSQIDVSSLPAGIYLVKAESEGASHTQRITIQR